MRSIKYFFFAIITAAACGCFSGCTTSKETFGSEDEFFVPLDSSQVPSIPRRTPSNQPIIQPITEEPTAQEPIKLSIAKPETVGVPLPGLSVDTGGESINRYIPPWERQLSFLPRGKYTVQSLKDSLLLVTEQVNLLQTILEASTIDRKMYYHAHVKAWYINNPALRDSLFYALMAIDSSIQSEAGTDAEVLATEDNDIIEVRFGTGIFKGITLKQALEKSTDKYLIQKVKESSLYSKDIELRDTTFNIPTIFDAGLLSNENVLDKFSFVNTHSNPEPVNLRTDFSLYGISFRAGRMWGGDIRVGNDELGFPFWSSGKISFLIMYKQLKAGLELPFKGGRGNTDQFVVPVSSRLLNGTRGFVGEFDFGSYGGKLSFSKMSSRDLASVTDPNNFYYITQEMLGYTSFGFLVTQTSMARLKVGIGHHQVRQGQVVTGTTDQFNEISKVSFSSMYFRFDFSHRDADEAYGCGVQYYNATLLTSAWLQIVPELLQLEIKYSKPVLRPVRDWESADFIMLSPRLMLSF